MELGAVVVEQSTGALDVQGGLGVDRSLRRLQDRDHGPAQSGNGERSGDGDHCDLVGLHALLLKIPGGFTPGRRGRREFTQHPPSGEGERRPT